MKIKNKINISFIITFILIISLVGLAVGIYTTSLVKKNVYTYLSSSNIAKARHIRTFIQDQETRAIIIAAASIYRDLLIEPVDSKNYLAIKTKIDKHLIRTIEADPQIIEAFILDTNGKIVVSSDKTKEGIDKSKDSYFNQALNNVFVKDVYFSQSTNNLNYAIAAPIKDDEGTLLGVSVLRYIPENFFSIVKNENGLGKTEENYLVNHDKFFITPSLFLGEGVILKQKVETENVNNCFNIKEIEYVKKNGYTGIAKTFVNNVLETKDYRNIDVIATHSYIPETGWCLVTKADKSDVLSFKFILAIILLVIFIIAGSIFLLVGYFISNKITNPIEILKQGIEKIKKGDYNYKTQINTGDEIEELSESFNSMTLAVKQSREEVDKKVIEQTKEVKNKSFELQKQTSSILNVLEDVQKEKNKTVLLARDLEKFKLAVENVSDHVVITDPEGIVIYGNKAIEKITGYKVEEVLGTKAGILWKKPMEKVFYEKLWETIKIKRATFKSEITNVRKNGEEYQASISISPVLDGGGNILFFVGLEHDITKEKEVDKAKTEFVSLASHQLRTPLSTINWYTEMLLAGDAGEINENQKKYLDEIYTGNQRMVDLVNSLLNVSRLELGTFVIEPELVDIVELGDSITKEVKPLVDKRKQILEYTHDNDISKILIDSKLLRIVFQNLLSNSIKYTPEEGRIKFDIHNIKKGNAIAGVNINEDSLLISVADNGYGISNNQHDKIFSKLFRADNIRDKDTEGTGLGLYIIKTIIDNSGGQIWFESEEDKGTTFYVVIPLSGMKKREGSKALS